MARDHNHIDFGLLVLDLFEKADPIHLGHPDIQKNQTGPLRTNHIQDSGPIRRLKDTIAFVAQNFPDRFPNPFLVVHHEDRCLRRFLPHFPSKPNPLRIGRLPSYFLEIGLIRHGQFDNKSGAFRLIRPHPDVAPMIGHNRTHNR